MAEFERAAPQLRLFTTQSIEEFMCLMADILRLPDETLGLSFLYYNRYKRFHNAPPGAPPLLDAYTLALTSLTLATKTTSNPRRLRSILLPAHRLLKPRRLKPTLPPDASREESPEYIPERLTIPSAHYDNLRATLVRAELIHLRVLKFELRLHTPFEYLPRFLERALRMSNIGEEPDVVEDYDSWGREQKEEDGVVGLMETRAGRAATARALDLCKIYKVINFYPARAIAAAAVRTTNLREYGFNVAGWYEYVTSGTVDLRDCREINIAWEEAQNPDNYHPSLDDVVSL